MTDNSEDILGEIEAEFSIGLDDSEKDEASPVINQIRSLCSAGHITSEQLDTLQSRTNETDSESSLNSLTGIEVPVTQSSYRITLLTGLRIVFRLSGVEYGL